MSKNKKLPDNQITVYQTPDGNINIEVPYSNENIWLPQKRMAELFGCSVDNISLHLKNTFEFGELQDDSERATQFRQWAINILRDFTIRGYVLDKERLKNGSFFNKEYFDHLLAEIREIRASERRFYSC